MANKPVYEVAKVLDDKVFIVELTTDYYDMNSFYKELKKEFPNRRIILNAGLAYAYDATDWYEIIDGGREILYNEELPDMKIWNKILNHG